MKVLVICEDPRHDQYIVRPVVSAVMEAAGLRAQVDVLTDPPLHGIDEALDPRQVAAIVGDNRMIDVFVLVVDRDCDRRQNESRARARVAEHGGRLLACLAWQEAEVWMLALHRERIGVGWSEVRAHCDPKETYVDGVLDMLGRSGPGGGRKAAMRALAGQWRTLVSICPEVAQLVEDVKGWAKTRP